LLSLSTPFAALVDLSEHFRRATASSALERGVLELAAETVLTGEPCEETLRRLPREVVGLSVVERLGVAHASTKHHVADLLIGNRVMGVHRNPMILEADALHRVAL